MAPEAKVVSDMQTAMSADGQEIAYWRSGSGPPLVLVHGSISDRTAWVLVQPALEERFTVYAVNRRGREGSGTLAGHAIEREFKDVAAIVDVVGEPVHLLGHSFGAVCSLGATQFSTNIRSLMLSEPPALGDTHRDVTAEIAQLVRDGLDDDALTAFLTKAVDVSTDDAAQMRASAIWPRMITHLKSLVEEMSAGLTYRFDASQYADLEIPVLLLVGSKSKQRARAVNDALAGVLPNAELRELPGTGHAGHLDSPELFVAEVTKFIDEVQESP